MERRRNERRMIERCCGRNGRIKRERNEDDRFDKKCMRN